jgi:hypothetical protein
MAAKTAVSDIQTPGKSSKNGPDENVKMIFFTLISL